MIRVVCAPPKKMLQCRCPPEHLRSSASAPFMEFVIHPVGFRTNAGPSTSVHHSPKGQWSPTTLTTPGMSRISRIIHTPNFSRARGVRAERIFHRRSVSCTTHTKDRCCCIPSRASAHHRSESLDKFCSRENAAQRGDPTSESVFSSTKHSRALMRSASLLKSYPVRRSIAVPGRKSNRLARTVNRPGQKISHVRFGLSQSSHQHA